MTRLSHSAREKYVQCGYKYYLHYIGKYRSTNEPSALIFGTAFDTALNDMLNGSNEYHSVFDVAWDSYKDATILYYKSDLNESLLTEDELTLSLNDKCFISMRRKGHRMLDAYFAEIYPRLVKVLSIQDEITIVGYDDEGNASEDSITGKLDLIAMIQDGDNVRHALLDNKTTSEPYTKNSVVKKEQLALYAVAFPEIDTFGYLTINKKTFKTQVILDTISEERKQEVLGLYVDVLDSINNNVFDKNEKSCYAFGKRCEFYTHCKHGNFSKDIYKKKD